MVISQIQVSSHIIACANKCVTGDSGLCIVICCKYEVTGVKCSGICYLLITESRYPHMLFINNGTMLYLVASCIGNTRSPKSPVNKSVTAAASFIFYCRLCYIKRLPVISGVPVSVTVYESMSCRKVGYQFCVVQYFCRHNRRTCIVYQLSSKVVYHLSEIANRICLCLFKRMISAVNDIIVRRG